MSTESLSTEPQSPEPQNPAAVLIEREAGVAVVTLNVPERRNALTLALKSALRDALAEVADDGGVRAVVLAANGPAFCVGQDLGEHAAKLAEDPDGVFSTVTEHYTPVVRSMMTMPKPVIAAVEGMAVGAGLGFALAADFRVFASGVKLGAAFSGIGLTFDSGLSYTLPGAVGQARARELMLFPRIFTAEEGISWGISGETVEPGSVLARARELAVQLAAGPTRAFAETKALLLNGVDLEAVFEAEARAQTRAGQTEDHRNAVSAFLNREKPVFTGA
ncbi:MULTISPECIES: enoyl-CoA hydratase-related protein [Arthrobacter]|uniref:Enoyl-CoA hydratase-related protein n=2 Tax=Arthrobacter TaxID=1663 RepID=A0ABU9KMJ5_9MICC|nr:enoyl-CoA hydratase-related protein [Arthrobacter sp. YJM1]MDP5227324.1 enoyl-CoA hydratase-related protein [Arthrobacter sp. YJM1]